MTYFDLYDCFQELVDTGKVQKQFQNTFANVLQFFLDKGGEKFFEDCDEELDETDTLSTYTIEQIRTGKVLDLDLAEFIEYVAKDIMLNIEADDDDMGTNWKTQFGW